jgi:hypothetical protein
MRLMWRSTHEALVAEMQRELADVRADRRKLLATILRMKLTGAAITPKPVPGKAPESDPIGVAIERASDGDSALARHLRKMAALEQKKGTPTDKIVDLITNGPPTGDGD